MKIEQQWKREETEMKAYHPLDSDVNGLQKKKKRQKM